MVAALQQKDFSIVLVVLISLVTGISEQMMTERKLHARESALTELPRDPVRQTWCYQFESEGEMSEASDFKLRVIPLSLAEANAFVSAHHRHHGPVVGHKFSLGAAIADKIVGVAIVGRPVSRLRDDGMTLEVSRLCTDGTRNACSFLYGACARAAFALGFKRIGTYILKSENGTSIKAAGWRMIGETPGRSWSVASRPRVDTHPLEPRLLFEAAQ